MGRRVLLMILDGWGIAKNKKYSAIDHAQTPFIDSLYARFPNSKLEASGLSVGLPEGQMGNSEVGHMNIGAGRIVYQDLVRINQAFEKSQLDDHPVLMEAFQYALTNKKKIHLIGLVSNGGVHSHINHLKGICTIAAKNGITDLFIHAFMDGRDTDPNGGIDFLSDLQNYLPTTTGKIASVIGRYYAMDRDKRWERIKLAYDMLVHGIGEKSTNVLKSIEKAYAGGITDEFIKPIVMVENGQPLATINKGDVVICFNFRTDRGRQITMALSQQDFEEYNMRTLDLHYVTLARYDDTFKNVKVVFEKDNLEFTLGEVLSKSNRKQIRIAETEKYPHVTYFFSGGHEESFSGEERILCPSPKVATYDLQPEMSARDIKGKIIPELNSGAADFICLNFANPDMVGHTGVFKAAVRACETVDQCTKEVVEAATSNGYAVLIIADHGNADIMINEDGTPNTAHTTNLVPCFLINSHASTLADGKLADVAPTILELMEITVPEVMTGKSLLND